MPPWGSLHVLFLRNQVPYRKKPYRRSTHPHQIDYGAIVRLRVSPFLAAVWSHIAKYAGPILLPIALMSFPRHRGPLNGELLSPHRCVVAGQITLRYGTSSRAECRISVSIRLDLVSRSLHLMRGRSQRRIDRILYLTPPPLQKIHVSYSGNPKVPPPYRLPTSAHVVGLDD